MTTHLAIRQSGGANILSIPKAILKALNLHTGSTLNLSIKNHKIILTPIEDQLTLKALLAESPKKNLAATKEDHEWVQAKPVGKEK
jgi:antitoxin component of MazEF toxin-antitoxin module